jgi:hypothetical protein
MAIEFQRSIIMAISAVTIVRTVSSWLTRGQTKEAVVASKPAHTKDAGASSIGWGALDEEERLRVRKAGLDLITFKSFNRGY